MVSVDFNNIIFFYENILYFCDNVECLYVQALGAYTIGYNI